MPAKKAATESAPSTVVKVRAILRPLWSSEPPTTFLRQGSGPVAATWWRSSRRAISAAVRTGENPPDDRVEARTAGAVELEVAEQQQQPFEMRQPQPVIHGIQRVGNGVADPGPVEIGHQFVEVEAQPLAFPVLRLGDGVGQHMHFAAVLGKVGCDPPRL